jgi:hypothetical protein
MNEDHVQIIYWLEIAMLAVRVVQGFVFLYLTKYIVLANLDFYIKKKLENKNEVKIIRENLD